MVEVEEKIYYFAYGSNIDELQMTQRCPDSFKIYKGFIKNYKLFASHDSKTWKGGVFSIKEENKSMVYGIIYEISSNDLHFLDMYEGYPTVYDRVELNIDILGGLMAKKKQLKCITYISNKIEENCIVSDDYLYHCENAANIEGITLLL